MPIDCAQMKMQMPMRHPNKTTTTECSFQPMWNPTKNKTKQKKVEEKNSHTHTKTQMLAPMPLSFRQQNAISIVNSTNATINSRRQLFDAEKYQTTRKLKMPMWTPNTTHTHT